MASTNEDVVVLATARHDDGRVLLLRHLPDRGTVELGWWQQEGGAVVAQAPVLELAAEGSELAALEEVCRQIGAAAQASAPLEEGAELVATRDGGDVLLTRRPETDGRVTLPQAMLEALLTTMLPEANARLARLGFGLPQHQGGGTGSATG